MRKIKLIAGACCLSVAVMGAVLGTALGGKITQAKAYVQQVKTLLQGWPSMINPVKSRNEPV